jgi:glutamate dehydrogenase/leucine dehydrogenase
MGCQHIEKENIPALWTEPYDIIVLANYNKCEGFHPSTLNCKFVVETVDGVLTEPSVNMLFQRGICVIPDLLVNTGSLTSNYLEWLINLRLLKYNKATERIEGLDNNIMSECLMKYFKELEKMHNDEFKIFSREESRDAILEVSKEVQKNRADKVIDIALKGGINLKSAAYTLGFENLVRKYKTIH